MRDIYKPNTMHLYDSTYPQSHIVALSASWQAICHLLSGFPLFEKRDLQARDPMQMWPYP